ncbi:MAG: tRNA (adenosine(37)-N6)-threonylcarbamoyltransferase complex ATPase subunit type 1 TsaE [Ruminococcaceae bacterium]|nr:tRNA (adenosine(37)-N6)-threonylcarbamoyltransferase complex ATPase subunit type 1 TsaE [Oscillospiraceae bacterium]
MLRILKTNDAQETETVGAVLASELGADSTLPPFLALYGDLGVGKTAFVRGFVSQIAPSAIVRSPTFALVHEYRAKPRSVFHFDMYRIESEDDLYSIGFYDYLDRNGICLVEWSEKIPFALPNDYIRVTIEKSNAEAPNERTIRIERITEDSL